MNILGDERNAYDEMKEIMTKRKNLLCNGAIMQWSNYAMKQFMSRSSKLFQYQCSGWYLVIN